jgi:hypothetical protein
MPYSSAIMSAPMPCGGRLEHLRTEGHAELTFGAGGSHRRGRHDLDPQGDDDVVCAGHDSLGREMDRLLARTALPVDGGGWNRFGPACGEYGVSAEIEGLLPDLADTAGDNVVDDGGIDTGALFERL